ncbi:curlin-associated protein [Halomonas sp. GFAJ-1]|uniref:curlin-associated protein n=1 Tax=Halomonas sp. GFAJ-1 TaxID=1118153 RepID=UPI00023A5986|nr:curlin-associated protein [Halomonas sp. GFAJ-1]AVI61907.1 hypothetical protein BB497_03925 [Halomonas sp. GFAJ-1]EHK61082.1 curlin-associated protein [Halomonas sp. GFAJ-1]
MKLQMTALAAAVSLALSGAAFAQQTVQEQNNLQYNSVTSPAQGGGWGLDNLNTPIDNDAWTTSGFPIPRNGEFSGFQGDLDAMTGSTANGNESTINQTTTLSSTTGNVASVLQGGGTDNQSTVTQNKTGTGDALSAYVDQQGNDNVSSVEQDLSYDATANVFQDGNANQARVTQLGANQNRAQISQTGADHKSIIEQGILTGGASGNVAWSEQSGAANESFIKQGRQDNYADAQQHGNDGLNMMRQRGNDNDAYLMQTGNDNESYVFQDSRNAGAGNSAVITQSGSDNDSYADQVGGGNEVTVTQSGNDALSTIYQRGDNNVADVSQSGGFDASNILQFGDGHEANVIQSGNGVYNTINESHILQTGSASHFASVTQQHVGSGWNNISTITQDSAANASATVNQMGSGNRASTIQY